MKLKALAISALASISGFTILTSSLLAFSSLLTTAQPAQAGITEACVKRGVELNMQHSLSEDADTVLMFTSDSSAISDPSAFIYLTTYIGDNYIAQSTVIFYCDTWQYSGVIGVRRHGDNYSVAFDFVTDRQITGEEYMKRSISKQQMKEGSLVWSRQSTNFTQPTINQVIEGI